MVNVLDVHSGNFMAAALSQTDKKICVVKRVARKLLCGHV